MYREQKQRTGTDSIDIEQKQRTGAANRSPERERETEQRNKLKNRSREHKKLTMFLITFSRSSSSVLLMSLS
jgi:hypothetical protein